MNFKKLLSLVGAMALTFGMVACGDDATGAGTDDGTTISDITEYVDDEGNTDGSYSVEVAFPAGSEVEGVEFELTAGSGTWQFSGDELSDGEDDEGVYFSNYFYPSCSGDFTVTVSYTLDGSAGTQTTSTTIEDSSLDACSDEPTSSSSTDTTTSSSSIANVPFTDLESVTLGAQGASEKSAIDLDTWTLYSTATEASGANGADIDLVFANVSEGLSLMTASAAQFATLGTWGDVEANDEVSIVPVNMTATEFAALDNLSDFDVEDLDLPNLTESIVVEDGMVLWVQTSLASSDIYLILVEGTDSSGNTATLTIKGLSAEQPAE